MPWQLNVARVVAPLVAGYTALQALGQLLAEEFQSFRLRFLYRHVVICGLGRKGLILARAFLERGQAVVVIEQDAENDFVRQARDLGAAVLLGDAAEPSMLRKARVARATHLFARCGDDGVNAEIAVRAGQLVTSRSGPLLTCVLHRIGRAVGSSWRVGVREVGTVGESGVEFWGGRNIREPGPENPELRRCQRTSPRPNFIVLRGQLFGQHAEPQDRWSCFVARIGDAKLKPTVLENLSCNSTKTCLAVRCSSQTRLCLNSPRFCQGGALHSALSPRPSPRRSHAQTYRSRFSKSPRSCSHGISRTPASTSTDLPETRPPQAWRPSAIAVCLSLGLCSPSILLPSGRFQRFERANRRQQDRSDGAQQAGVSRSRLLRNGLGAASSTQVEPRRSISHAALFEVLGRLLGQAYLQAFG
jgi:hypothetical protein